MIEIAVQKIPNQEFDIELGGHRYNIEIRTFNEMTLMSVKIDDVDVKRSVRCCANQKVIPYNYLTKGGNLIWRCIDDDYPHYTKFGDTQFLYYATDEELAQLEG